MANRVDRRAFLNLVLGGAAALAVMPKLEAIAALNPSLDPDEITGPVWDEIYNQILEESWAGFVSKVGPFSRSRGVPTEPFTERDGYKFAPMGVMIARPQLTARSAGANLGALCHEKGWNVYAPPLLPQAVEVARTAHEVLRYVRVWDAMGSDMINRIDVYGAKA